MYVLFLSFSVHYAFTVVCFKIKQEMFCSRFVLMNVNFAHSLTNAMLDDYKDCESILTQLCALI